MNELLKCWSPSVLHNNSKGFEGSYLGDDSQINEATRMECKICWYIYDPAIGDDFWQVPPGTPFSQLPPEWRCPDCDGEKDQFMVLTEEDT
ncbi:rubredoxin [Thiomicrorhabdus sp. HH1]|uniref:Rubredoxin n=1 Tax=Thiomicrorhabdus heinhorstiae TaxID=2748010 RepID=A0ABS0C0A3_9GAMM|nr:rubredoxin [Thiomicrorhabdus heinhorstiae]